MDGEREILRAQLGRLARSRRAVAVQPAGPGAVSPRDDSRREDPREHGRQAHDDLGVDAYLPGGEWRDARGRVWVHERLRSDVEKRRAHWGRLGAPEKDEADLEAIAARGLERAVFLDLETGGLASSPVFLAGTMHWSGEDFVLRQYFARHYGEEATLIGALNEAMKGFEFLVTFNGKSYDAPFLKGRAHVHGVPLALPPRHVDLLHPARRKWSDRLPDCRLQTLEFHVCRRRRSGDVPSEEVPGLYHDFVRRGDPYRLVPVFHHNLLDVITMGEILRSLCPGKRPGGMDSADGGFARSTRDAHPPAPDDVPERALEPDDGAADNLAGRRVARETPRASAPLLPEIL